MILQSLTRLYDRLLGSGTSDIARFGYSQEKISFEIILSASGSVVAVNDLRDTSGKKPLPRSLSVPQPAKRTVNIRPNFLWDKTSYTLGVGATSNRLAEEQRPFTSCIPRCWQRRKIPGCSLFYGSSRVGSRLSSLPLYSATTFATAMSSSVWMATHRGTTFTIGRLPSQQGCGCFKRTMLRTPTATRPGHR